jgi:hypothetical protein
MRTKITNTPVLQYSSSFALSCHVSVWNHAPFDRNGIILDTTADEYYISLRIKIQINETVRLCPPTTDYKQQATYNTEHFRSIKVAATP